jgi:ABC-type transport system involved in multi-copper enzyme maturation permease subunit
MWLLALHALREAAHLKLAWVLTLAALALVTGVSALREFNFGIEEARFFADLTRGTLLLFGTAQAILLTVAIVHGGLEKGVPGLLFTRGVRRWEWMVASLGAVWVSLGWLALGAYLLLGFLLASHGHAISPGALSLECGHAVLRLGLVACFALATCAVCRSPLLAASLALALTLTAQLAPIIGLAESQGRPAVRLAWGVLARILPDFAALEAPSGAATSVLYAAGYAALYTTAACLVFSRREL